MQTLIEGLKSELKYSLVLPIEDEAEEQQELFFYPLPDGKVAVPYFASDMLKQKLPKWEKDRNFVVASKEQARVVYKTLMKDGWMLPPSEDPSYELLLKRVGVKGAEFKGVLLQGSPQLQSNLGD